MKKRKMIDYEPNKAYLVSGSWLDVSSGLKNPKKAKRQSVWVKLEITPDLFDHADSSAAGIIRAYERGYLEIKASLNDDGNIYLSVLVDQNMGDEDGFGVEPDSYLEGVVALDGTFVEPLHIR
jgi:hypothetical protein